MEANQFTEERMKLIEEMFFDAPFQSFLFGADSDLHGKFFSLFNDFIFNSGRTTYTEVEKVILSRVRGHYINYKTQKV